MHMAIETRISEFDRQIDFLTQDRNLRVDHLLLQQNGFSAEIQEGKLIVRITDETKDKYVAYIRECSDRGLLGFVAELVTFLPSGDIATVGRELLAAAFEMHATILDRRITNIANEGRGGLGRLINNAEDCRRIAGKIRDIEPAA